MKLTTAATLINEIRRTVSTAGRTLLILTTRRDQSPVHLANEVAELLPTLSPYRFTKVTGTRWRSPNHEGMMQISQAVCFDWRHYENVNTVLVLGLDTLGAAAREEVEAAAQVTLGAKGRFISA